MIKIKIKQSNKFLKDFDDAVASARKGRIPSLVAALRAATPVDTGNARDGWKSSGSTIYNEVDYIDNLNSGSSKQAPTRFIEKTLLAQDGVRPNGVIVKTL